MLLKLIFTFNMAKSKYFRYSYGFDLSKENNNEAPKNARDFILWFVGYQLSTYYSKSGKLHCNMWRKRSLDDTYALVNKRWPMSEIEFLDLVHSVSQGNHGNLRRNHGMKYIYFSFCPNINKIVMMGTAFPPKKVAISWAIYPSFNDEKIFSPLLREYAINNL